MVMWKSNGFKIQFKPPLPLSSSGNHRLSIPLMTLTAICIRRLIVEARGGQSKVPVVPLSKIELRHSEDPRLSIGHFENMCKNVSLMPGGVD